ncbi:hypothetical protein RUESEDTHA_03847 [Ruegeria sp. THAF57]|nr:hypothetical protein RUESEDTHA_03847 [Ruegeria sp. THAF57]
MKSSRKTSGLRASGAVMATGAVHAESDWESFPGAVVEAKLIGVQQYCGLYGSASLRGTKPQAPRSISSRRKNYFEINKCHVFDAGTGEGLRG